MTYNITVEEMLSRTIAIEADSAEEAEDKVRDSYRSGELVLGADDFSGYARMSIDGSEFFDI